MALKVSPIPRHYQVDSGKNLYADITSRALCWSVARASVAEIDRFNILQATLMAMRRAVMGLRQQPDFVAVDGNRLPQWEYHGEAVVKGRWPRGSDQRCIDYCQGGARC